MFRCIQGPLYHRLSRDPINDNPAILVADVEVRRCYKEFMHHREILRYVYNPCCGGEDAEGVEFGSG